MTVDSRFIRLIAYTCSFACGFFLIILIYMIFLPSHTDAALQSLATIISALMALAAVLLSFNYLKEQLEQMKFQGAAVALQALTPVAERIRAEIKIYESLTDVISLAQSITASVEKKMSLTQDEIKKYLEHADVAHDHVYNQGVKRLADYDSEVETMSFLILLSRQRKLLMECVMHTKEADLSKLKITNKELSDTQSRYVSVFEGKLRNVNSQITYLQNQLDNYLN